MLIIYFYIYIYININFLFHPFSLKGGVAEFWTVSVSVSGFAPRPEKNPPKEVVSQILFVTLPCRWIFCFFLQHEDTLNFSTWQDLGRFCCSGYQKYNKL